MNEIDNLLALIKLNFTENTLFKNILGSDRLVVYGCGGGYITFSMFVLEKYGYKPNLIIDQKFSAPTFVGDIPAKSLEHINSDDKCVQDGLVVITIGDLILRQAIEFSLRKKGFKRIISAFDIYEYHLSHAAKEMNAVDISFYENSALMISGAFESLADSKSCEVFKSMLTLYASRNIVPISSDGIENQYLPEDVPLSRGYSRLINCGAYDGDTIRNIYSRIGKFSSILCFEPDIFNFNRLIDYLTRQSNIIADHILALPLGVGECDALIPFNMSGSTNSGISNPIDGSGGIFSVKIDSILIDYVPTMINMDVEGAELKALRGAKRILSTHRPDLAISVYHQPSDLWEILNYLKSLNLDYKFYLRNYTGYPAETVLYATQ